MLLPIVDQYVRHISGADQVQTTCRPAKAFYEYATDFQTNSRAGFGKSRSKDGLTRIDELVRAAAQIRTEDHMRIAYVAELLVKDIYQWITGHNPSNPTQLLDINSINRRRDAVTTLLGGAYCWYKQSSEAATSEPNALTRITAHQDIPFQMYQYRFSRRGFNLHPVNGRLYRGDTRPPAMLFQAGGFFPKMDNANRHDPHLGSGASCQVISTTDDANVVAGFAWHNPAYCPVKYYYIHETEGGGKPISGFIYEVDKTGHQCVEVAGVTPGREAAFLAIPNQFIRRFRMRYHAGHQGNVVLSDWMYYNANSVQNIRIVSDRQRYDTYKRHYMKYATYS